MIKQIKKRFIALILCLIVILNCTVSFGAVNNSDVVESTSPKITSINDDTLFIIEGDEPLFKEDIYYGWTTAAVNVRESPDINSAIVTVLPFNTPIEYIKYDDDWVEYVFYEDTSYYISTAYISDTKCDYREIAVPAHSKDFKSYMSYKAITRKSSLQYKLQANYAYTGLYGIRMVNNRFCVAIGSYFGTQIGQYFDLVLANGTVIPCIMGDLKANQDTDRQHIFSRNGCCSEFLIDKSALVRPVKNSGNVSSATPEWNSPVVAIRVYDTNVFI